MSSSAPINITCSSVALNLAVQSEIPGGFGLPLMSMAEEAAAGGSPVIRPPWSVLEGKVVMVTGASSGIGRDFCVNLARAGCRIVAAARRTDRLRSLCEEINGGSGSSSASSDREPSSVRAVAVELDVSAGGAAIEASVQKAWEAFGGIDALVNNAGVRGNLEVLKPVTKLFINLLFMCETRKLSGFVCLFSF